jgi:hypothetical protein
MMAGSLAIMVPFADPAMSCTARAPIITGRGHLRIACLLVDQSLKGSCVAFDYPGFWSHSLFMAVASQELGRSSKNRAPGDA